MNMFFKTLSGCIYGSNKINLIRRLQCNYRNVRKYFLPGGEPKEITAFVATLREKINGSNNNGRYIERYGETSLENLFIHKYFEDSRSYRSTVVSQKMLEIHVPEAEVNKLLNTDWSTKSNKEILTALRRLAHNVLSNKSSQQDYVGILSELKNKCASMNVQEMREMLLHLQLLSEILQDFKPYKVLNDHIGKLLVKSLSSMTYDEKLLLLDCLYKCQFCDTKFPWYIVRNLGAKLHRLNARQLIQFLFYVNVFHSSHVINMFETQVHLESCLQELTINEIGIAAICLFRCRSGIRNSVLYYEILNRTIKEMEQIDPMLITGFMKIIRFKIHHDDKLFEKLFTSLIPQIPKYTTQVARHVIHVMTKYPYYHEDLLRVIIDRFEKELHTLRLKDIEGIVHILSLFNMPPSKFGIYQKIIDELTNNMDTSRKNEIENFAYCLLDIVCYMSYVNLYPTKLLERVMNPEFVKKIRNGHLYKLRTEHFILDCNLRIEHPDYKGPFLPPEIADYYFKKYTLFEKDGNKDTTDDYVKITNYEKFLLEVIYVVKEIFQCPELPLFRTLPQFNSRDIIFGLDENKNIIMPDKSAFLDNVINCINFVNCQQPNIKWIVCVLGNVNSRIYGKEKSENGTWKYHVYLHTKLRQLKIIGYETILLPENEWYKQGTLSNKETYLRHKLNKCFDTQTYFPNRTKIG